MSPDRPARRGGFLLAALILSAAAPPLHPRPAAAAFIATRELVRACSAHDVQSEADCTGYLLGVADAAQLRGAESGVCLPAGVSVRGLREAVLPRLRRAEERDGAAAVMAALRALYPCAR